MLILLPPSERKNEVRGQRKFELSKLIAAPELSKIRAELLGDQNPEFSAPAIEIYSGVLYQSLDWSSLSKPIQDRGNSRILIFSALFGVLRPTDLIFKYKAKIKNSLWSEAISNLAIKYQGELVIDCRSTTYKRNWPIDPELTVEIRVFQITGEKRSTITHMSKKYRGELTRFLLQQMNDPQTPKELFKLVSSRFDCELLGPEKSQPWRINLLIS